jgi:DNA-binding NarL/FixJ family response regulator
MTRILIIEDEIIIARFIEQQVQANFACETRIAISADEAREAVKQMLPHLVLCDINLQDHENGIGLISDLRRHYHFEVIYITSYQSKEIIEQATATKPSNYIIKPVDEAQLYAGVQLVMAGIKSNPALGTAIQQPEQPLSKTERRVLELIQQHKTTREIADILNLSPHTVKNHRHNICRKLNLKNENNALLRYSLDAASRNADESVVPKK